MIERQKMMGGINRDARKFAGRGLAIALLIVQLTGCALYRNDHCFVPEKQYLTARDLFVSSGSMDIVERQLESFEWRRCKINEVLYRLDKEFQVLPEEIMNEATTRTLPLASMAPNLN